VTDVFISNDVQPMISAGLASSFDLDPIGILERQLADANDRQDSLSAVTAWVTSRAHNLDLALFPSVNATWVPAVWRTSVYTATHYSTPETVIGNAWQAFTRRAIEALQELSDQIPELGASTAPPLPDPQPVDSRWLQGLSSISSRESSDLYSWYASMEEE
jgi:hypothetical protein